MSVYLHLQVAKHKHCYPYYPLIENFLINELIVEYLSFNGYDQTLSIFATESQMDQRDFMLGGSFIRTELVYWSAKTNKESAEEEGSSCCMKL